MQSAVLDAQVPEIPCPCARLVTASPNEPDHGPHVRRNQHHESQIASGDHSVVPAALPPGPASTTRWTAHPRSLGAAQFEPDRYAKLIVRSNRLGGWMISSRATRFTTVLLSTCLLALPL